MPWGLASVGSEWLAPVPLAWRTCFRRIGQARCVALHVVACKNVSHPSNHPLIQLSPTTPHSVQISFRPRPALFSVKSLGCLVSLGRGLFFRFGKKFLGTCSSLRCGGGVGQLNFSERGCRAPFWFGSGFRPLLTRGVLNCSCHLGFCGCNFVVQRL